MVNTYGTLIASSVTSVSHGLIYLILPINPLKQTLYLYAFYRWGARVRRFNNLPKVI